MKNDNLTSAPSVAYPIKVFSAAKILKNSAILQAPNDFTFHLWTQPTSCYHSHENYIEIFIVTKGKLTHHFGKEKTTMQTGDAFIMLPNQFHKHSPYKNYSSQHVNLTCNIPYAKDIFKMYFKTETPTFHNQMIKLNAKAFEMVLAFQQLVLEAQTESAKTLAVKAFISFVFSLFNTNENIAPEKPIPDWLQNFILKLNDFDFTSDFNLSDIYALSNYSQTTLSREFKKHVGKTLIAYVNDLKLNYACNQLKHTDLSILAISSSLGFDSLSHFSHLFKKKYGITPLQYRKS
ncbi:MAG: AraC family transcriptional regulator [Clostridia bacterium]|nr:AraC family transcriptional regulator [Clostridia bacterium]